MLYCGIDIGTTNTKAVVLNSNLELLDKLTIPVGSVGGGDQLPAETWFEHFCGALEYFKSKNLFRDSGATGWKPDRWMMACKVKEFIEDKTRLSELSYISTVPDFIHARLGKMFVTDITNAQIAGLCDFQSADWDSDILKWAGVDRNLLPRISTSPEILLDGVSVAETKIRLATSSHDQYAAMLAGRLHQDLTVMLGTGTAWVINGKSRQAQYDYDNFLVHPGRDLLPNYFGYIAIVGSIGKGFDTLLQRLRIEKSSLPEIESEIAKADAPERAIEVVIDDGTVRCEGSNPILLLRRYMEAAAARVAFILEKLRIKSETQKLVMTGGAASSSCWPTIIAQVCGMPVEVINFGELTAYGAALFARAAATGESNVEGWPSSIKTIVCEPEKSDIYQQWYRKHQKPAMEKEGFI